MSLVLSRNFKNIVFKSSTNFLSKIVIHKFENESKEVIRRLEKFTKWLIIILGRRIFFIIACNMLCTVRYNTQVIGENLSVPLKLFSVLAYIYIYIYIHIYTGCPKKLD